jgi:hypothetical protein
MKHIKLLAFILLISAQSWAQSFVINDLSTLSDNFSFERSRANTTGDLDTYYNVTGSPYLTESFVTGEIVMNDSIKFVNIPLRLNMYTNMMEFRNQRNQILEIDTFRNYAFFVGGLTLKTTTFIENNLEKKGVLQVLVDGDIKLLKRQRVAFKAATKPEGFKDKQPNMFVRETDRYFLSINGQTPVSFSKRKTLLNKLIEAIPEIEQYAKNNRVRINSEESLIKLFEFSNNN